VQKNTGCPKAILRKEMKKVLSTLSEKALMEKSENVYNHLVDTLNGLINIPHSDTSKSMTIGAYAPMKGEVNWLELERDYQIAYPCLEKDLMIFKEAKYSELTICHDFGVPLRLPQENASIVTPKVLLIPGLAFSKEGHRLGRGKGFYDRYLEKYKGLKVGICFSEQLKSIVPCEEHDVMMDITITDKNVFIREMQ
jgi:5-formyltetrahydrofolate cyclo-ligase